MESNNDQASKEKTQEEKTQEEKEAEVRQMIESVFRHTEQTLKTEFEECAVAGQAVNYPGFGPVFMYQLRNPEGQVYACGFQVNELINVFRSNNDPGTWLGSFFVALMRKEGNQPLPSPPQNEEETKALFDQTILPLCIEAVREEFRPETVHVGLNFHKEHGAVLEGGFPEIAAGGNVCAVTLQFLLMQYLLNRDPSEPLIHAMYKLRKDLGAE